MATDPRDPLYGNHPLGGDAPCPIPVLNRLVSNAYICGDPLEAVGFDEILECVHVASLQVAPVKKQATKFELTGFSC